MANKDPRIDAYIQKAQPFAQPILNRLRTLVHKAVPEVEETIKWGMPSFDYKGPFCSFASFKAHCSFGFWKDSVMKTLSGIDPAERAGGMGSFGRLTSLKDLPSDKEILAALKEAKELNDKKIAAPRVKTAPKEPLALHTEFAAALMKNPTAKKKFESFTPGKKREYLEWINSAKTDATRAKRIETAVPWIAEGKARNWKYERK